MTVLAKDGAARPAEVPAAPTFREATRLWAKIGPPKESRPGRSQ